MTPAHFLARRVHLKLTQAQLGTQLGRNRNTIRRDEHAADPTRDRRVQP